MDIKNLTLEKSFTNEKAVKAEMDSFNTQLISAGINLRKIHSYFNLKTLADVVKFADSNFIKKYLDQGEAEYLGRTFVPSSEKRRIHDQYSKVYKDVADDADYVKNFFANYPFKYTFEAGLCTLKADNDEVRKYFEKKYSRELTDEDCEYFEKFANVMKSLQDCSDWEQAHNYVNFTAVGDMLHPIDNNIYTLWQTGRFDGLTFTQMLGGSIGKIMRHEEQEED
jgi:hypothetical protein